MFSRACKAELSALVGGRRREGTYVLRSPGHVDALELLDDVAGAVSQEAVRGLELGNDVLEEEGFEERGELFLRSPHAGSANVPKR